MQSCNRLIVNGVDQIWSHKSSSQKLTSTKKIHEKNSCIKNGLAIVKNASYYKNYKYSAKLDLLALKCMLNFDIRAFRGENANFLIHFL